MVVPDVVESLGVGSGDRAVGVWALDADRGTFWLFCTKTYHLNSLLPMLYVRQTLGSVPCAR